MSSNDQTSGWRDTIIPVLSLFASTGTLICCALPALLVTLGMGASLAGLVGAAPWLSAITDYKEWLFAGAGILLALSVFMQWRGRNIPCPADPKKAKACVMLRKISWGILIASVLIYLVGFFFAFLAAGIFYG